MKIETPFDGNDTFGFPFIFFERFSQHCNPCPSEPTAMYWDFFLYDTLISFSFAFLLFTFIMKLKKRTNPKGILDDDWD